MKDNIKQKFYKLFRMSFIFNFIKYKLLPDYVSRKFIYSQNTFHKIIEGLLKNHSRYNPTKKQIFKNVIYKHDNQKIELSLDLNEYTQCGYFFNLPNPILKKLIINGGETFIDIGANVGIFSLMAQHYFQNVYSFEPMPKTFNLLNNNVNLTAPFISNKHHKIHTLNFAVSNISKNSKLYANPLNLGGSKLSKFGEKYKAISGIENGWDEYDTACITLDEFVQNQKIKNVSLVKIDVEGHEVETLEGAKDAILKYNPLIYIEISSANNYEKVVSLLPVNYSIWNPNTKNISNKYDNIDFILSDKNPFQ